MANATLRKRLFYRTVIMVSIFIFVFQPIQVLAIDEEFFSGNDIEFYNPNACSVDTGGDATLVGNKNAEKIWNFLVGNDGNLSAGDALTAEQAAGLMGNLMQESGYRPDAQEGNGVGYGIAQWSFGRRTNLEKAAKKKGVAVSDLKFQLQYLYEEAKSRKAIRGGGSEWEVMKKQKSINDALVFWHDSFERSADTPSEVVNRRGGYAKDAYNSFKDNVKTPSASGTAKGATVFLDPGHGAAIPFFIDKKSGLKTNETANSPERDDAMDVAKRVQAELEKSGYKVVLSRKGNTDQVNFRQRADAAAAAKAAIGVSIHTTPGNINEAWPQRVDTYRQYQGHKDTFGDTEEEKKTATTSEAYANTFAKTRAAAEGHAVDTDKGNVTQMGSFGRGDIASKGNIPLIELWSPSVPWVYNEIGQDKGTAISEKLKAAYAKGIIEGIKQSIPSADSQSGCGEGFTGGNLSETIKAYAWPTYKAPPYTTKKPEYEAAVKKAQADGRYVGGLQYPGVDCGGFVTTLMIDSGFEPGYNYESKVSKGAGITTVQEKWMKANWEYLGKGNTLNVSDLKQGDVAINVDHTFMFAGRIEGFETNIASAAVSFSGRSWRAPMAGRENPIDGKYNWYRKKG